MSPVSALPCRVPAPGEWLCWSLGSKVRQMGDQISFTGQAAATQQSVPQVGTQMVTVPRLSASTMTSPLSEAVCSLTEAELAF